MQTGVENTQSKILPSQFKAFWNCAAPPCSGAVTPPLFFGKDSKDSKKFMRQTSSIKQFVFHIWLQKKMSPWCNSHPIIATSRLCCAYLSRRRCFPSYCSRDKTNNSALMKRLGIGFRDSTWSSAGPLDTARYLPLKGSPSQDDYVMKCNDREWFHSGSVVLRSRTVSSSSTQLKAGDGQKGSRKKRVWPRWGDDGALFSRLNVARTSALFFSWAVIIHAAPGDRRRRRHFAPGRTCSPPLPDLRGRSQSSPPISLCMNVFMTKMGVLACVPAKGEGRAGVRRGGGQLRRAFLHTPSASGWEEEEEEEEERRMDVSRGM